MFNAKLFAEDLNRALLAKDWSIVAEIIDQLNEYMASFEEHLDGDEDCRTDPDVEIVEEGEE